MTADIVRLSWDLEVLLFGEHGGRKQMASVPWLTLPPGYSFQVLFPFFGAAARFCVCQSDKPDNAISVYLDAKDVLGYFGGPYWEAYPIEGGTARFAMAEGKELIESIVAELEKAA
jgi:hypothetical protein